LEEPFNLGIGGEYLGNAGRKVNGDPLYIGDAMLMAIGQGPVAWTPLHAADSYATLARGGLRITPRILADAPPQARDLHLDPESIDLAMRGLDLAANDELGTGSSIAYASGSEPIFDVPGVDVWGKTGTATAVSLLGEDPDGDGPEPRPVLRAGDHSWYVVLAGREGLQPRYAIAVIIEYGGSGGRVAGPVTEQIIYALVAEGYL
jgi:cell division protein FtsI/penicillin-binding protein 2